jgi:opacity protein-like surface antigen
MKKIISALLISAAAVSAPAFAEGFMDGQVGSKYAVVDLGFITYGVGGSATALGVGGGVQVHPAVAVEVDYLHGSTGTYGFFNGSQASLNAFQVWGVGHYTINDSFQAYAKAGVALNRYKWGLVGGATTTNSSTDLAAAIGIKMKLNDAVSLHAQYQDVGTQAANVLSVGAQFNF